MRKIGIILSLLAAVAPAAALAQNGSGIRVRHTFYEHGQVVGQFIELCDGTSYWTGYPTGQDLYELFDC